MGIGKGSVRNALQMKAEVGCYLRFVRQHPLVAMEALDQDILTVTETRRIQIVEVKVSVSDLKADWHKDWHYGIRDALGPAEMMAQPAGDNPEAWRKWGLANHARNWGMRIRHGEGRFVGGGWAPNEFWFGIPDDIIARAAEVVEELYPYAGILAVDSDPCRQHAFAGRDTRVERKATVLHARKAGAAFVARLVKAQSASLANAYTHFAQAAVRHAAERKEAGQSGARV